MMMSSISSRMIRLYNSLVVGIVVCFLFICHGLFHAGLVSHVSAKSELGPGEIMSLYSEYGRLESSSAVLQFTQVPGLDIWYLCVESTTYGFSSTSEEKRIWVPWKGEVGDYLGPKLIMDEGGRLVISTSFRNGTSSSSADFIINAEQHAYIKNTTAVLVSNGNLVLQSAEGKILWESFDHPTNVWFPGMKLGWFGRKTQRPHQRFLTSWISKDNPYPGAFTLGVDPNNTKQLVVWREGVVYWQSGSWNGTNFPFLPLHSNAIGYFSDDNQSYFVWNGDLGQADPIRMYATGEISARLDKIQCDYYGFSSEGCTRPNQSHCSSAGDWFDPITGDMVGEWEKYLYNTTLGISECREICAKNCSCNAYATSNPDGTGCAFSSSTAYEYVQYSGEALYIRHPVRIIKPHSKGSSSPVLVPHHSNQRKPHSNTRKIIAALAVAMVLILAIILVLCRMNPRKCRNCFTAPIVSSRQQLASKEEELPFFHFKTIEIATNYFSDENKLGQGGFGPVYKGILANGQEIAAKRLLKMSGQGIEQFKNEVLLISKLQHRNLVKLLGCSTQGDDEKILIYEYLPNKSLDSILFDERKKVCLDWRKRISIIDGIAQGLLYLHKYSRLKIIHRDLKTSNILLDIHMHPKISDFGTARIFTESDSQANTKNIVGTYGYMSPEYAMDGCFSEKSDVFSFGVMVMEIVSGKRNNGFYNPDRVSNLLGYVWDLWIEGRVSTIIDLTMDKTVSISEATRCIQIGLLCVQDCAADRPTMSNVVSMLDNESTILPIPKQPGFSTVMGIKCDDVGNNPKICSNNMVTISEIEGR